MGQAPDADSTRANCADFWAGEDVVTYEQWKSLMDAGQLPVGATTPVGAFAGSPAANGAWDMGGNVWEWTTTAIGNSAVIAGGSYDNPIRGIRASSRGVYARRGRSNAVGFRVAFEERA